MQKEKTNKSVFEKISCAVTKATGSSAAFIIALFVIFLWLASGPIFKFSDTWQLVINTGTTIVTFLMVFLIQRSQNKDSVALHLKLNELVAAHKLASNRLIAVEDFSESDLRVLKKFYKHLAQLSLNELSVEESHSLNVANARHKIKTLAKESILKK